MTCVAIRSWSLWFESISYCAHRLWVVSIFWLFMILSGRVMPDFDRSVIKMRDFKQRHEAALNGCKIQSHDFAIKISFEIKEAEAITQKDVKDCFEVHLTSGRSCLKLWTQIISSHSLVLQSLLHTIIPCIRCHGCLLPRELFMFDKYFSWPTE